VVLALDGNIYLGSNSLTCFCFIFEREAAKKVDYCFGLTPMFYNEINIYESLYIASKQLFLNASKNPVKVKHKKLFMKF